MIEMITTYILRDSDIPIPMNRDDYYKEQIKVFNKTGEASRAVEVIGLLLFNIDGEIVLQKRSHEKNHNPHLIDKAIGGHIKHKDSPLYTLMVETVQELQIPSIVLRTDDDFSKTFKLLRSYLDSIAVVKELASDTFVLDRIINDKVYKLAHKVHLYIGVYSGATRPVDKEASGVLYYNLDILKKEMKARPDNFTHDLHLYLDKFSKDINKFIKYIRSNK